MIIWAREHRVLTLFLKEAKVAEWSSNPGVKALAEAIQKGDGLGATRIWQAMQNNSSKARSEWDRMTAGERAYLVGLLQIAGLNPEEVFPKNLVESCMKLGR